MVSSKRHRRKGLIAVLVILTALIGGLGWTVYAPIRQEKLNRALIAAIKQNNTKKALALLSEGADPNSRDDPPQNLSLWRMLLDKLRGKRPAPSEALTALQLACFWDGETGRDIPDNPVLVGALLDRGAAIEEKPPGDGRTPLLFATQWDKPQVSKLLIERGANVNAVDAWASTPLMHAAENNNMKLVRLLVNYGADVNAMYELSDEQWHSPLIAAISTKGDESTITEMLLSSGARVNGSTTLPRAIAMAWNPLVLAVSYDKPKTVQILLKHGAQVSLKLNEGYSLLQFAAENGDKMIIQMLKQASAKE